MNKLKYHFLGGLVFLGTVLFGYIGYTAYTNLAIQADGATITRDIWNDVINKVNTIGNTYAPTGAIMAFYLISCPTGRIIADGTNGTPDLRGEFIRGIDNGRGVDTGRTLASWQSDSIKNHRHYANPTNNSPSNGQPDYANTTINLDTQSNIRSTGDMIGGGTETHPRNVALLYCMKQ
ncbi:MAG: hypothetical protein PHR68_04485 [Candidatus Gracilibacteria bacterium]|nr:hypothetical protein [Candidatus Gracilibacteria bacterium]